MYERVSQEQPRSDAFAFDFGNGSTEDPSLDSNSLSAQSDTPPNNSTCTISTTSEIEQSAQKLEKHEILTAKNGDGTHATLARSALHEWFSTSFDVLLSLVPLFFLVIAILCLCLNGEPLSTYGENIEAITLLAPTIFPIAYAAVLGKALRRIGLFKAERSSTIGTLEQLIGSQSFFSSIEKQFGLRRINFLGAAIIAAWLLSPLGGQSSLRLLSRTSATAEFNSTIRYHSLDGFTNDTLFSVHMEENSWSRYAPLYMTALQTSRQTFQAPQDLFGKVKIPDIASIDSTNTATMAFSDWRDIKESTTTKYTSLLGHPVADVPRSGNASFAIESSYWEVNCGTFIPGANLTNGDSNRTSYSYRKLRLGPGVSSFEFSHLDLNGSGNITTSYGHRNTFSFFYLSKDSLSTAINATCTASLRVAESEVDCEGAVCRVRRMRYLNRDTPTWIRSIECPSMYDWCFFIDLLASFMPGADIGPRQLTGTSELIEQFITDPDLTAMIHSGTGEDYTYWANMSKLPTDVFSHRLSVAMNTFWDSTLGLQYHIGNLTTEDIEGGERSIDTWNTTAATGRRYVGEQYVCSITFAAITIVISLFLFVVANVSVVLGCITRAPDILGYVSTYARDDPYFSKHVPSHLSGMDTARSLRDVRVILGDVQKGENVGHVAFATMDAQPERVNKKRLYD